LAFNPNVVSQTSNPRNENASGTNVLYGGSGSPYFPGDLEKYAFWMSFSFYEYQAPAFTETKILADKGTIRLPLPNQMIDQLDVSYNMEAFTFGGPATAVALNAYRASPAGNPGNTAVNVAGGFAGGALTNLARLPGVAQQFGVTVNPFISVMFKSPSFKRHSFIWKLSPVNKKESNAIGAIINTFRFNQSPGVAESVGGTLLSYPNIVQLAVSNQDPNLFNYKFKPAVIDSFHANWAPNNQASFFGNKAPTEIEIRLSLIEIEYWLQSDFGNQTSGQIDVLEKAKELYDRSGIDALDLTNMVLM